MTRPEAPVPSPSALPMVAAVLLGVLFGPQLPAQFGREDDRSLFSVPRSQDDIHQRRLAIADIAAGDFEVAINRLQQTLEQGRPGLVEVEPDRFLGMRTAVIRILRDLPPAGQAAYDNLTEVQAGRLSRSAFEGRNPEELEVLAQRFPTSMLGRRARLRLGDLHLEAAEGRPAADEYAALLEAMPTDSPEREIATARLAAALSLVHPWHPDAAPDIVEQLTGGSGAAPGWSSYGGGGDGTRTMELPPAGGRDVAGVQLSSSRYGSDHLHAVHAVGGIDGLYFNTGQKVVAYDPIAGRVLWEGEGPMVGAYDADAYHESLSSKMLLSAAMSPDVVVAALQVPNDAKAQSYHSLELARKLPTRRLFAFDRSTGKLLWAHWDHQGGPKSERFVAHNAPAPPIIEGELVYAPTEHYTGAISYYLSAYDLRTGEPRMRTMICSSQLEVNMFGNARTEFAATPLAKHEGIIYGATNLGLCYAADGATGSVLWASAYPVVPLPQTRLQNQSTRAVYFENNPVIVADGVMVCTPLDSEHVLAFDTKTGSILWKLHWRSQGEHRNHLLWMLGLIGDEVILSGTGVIAVGLKPDAGGEPRVRQIAGPGVGRVMTGSLPRGAITDDKVLFPGPNGIQLLDGGGGGSGRILDVQETGNLLLVDGLLVTARADRVLVHRDRRALLERANAAIRAQPDEPAHYLRLAILLRGVGDLRGQRDDHTIQTLRRGIEVARRRGHTAESPLLRRLTTELSGLIVARAEAALEVRDTTRALGLFASARDAALTPEDWIGAQLRVLELHRGTPQPFLAELQRLEQRHGSRRHHFPGLGEMPVRAFVLIESIGVLEDPEQIVSRCQALIEAYPDLRVRDTTGRDFAAATVHDLIGRHGREIYAAVEARARARLEAAGEDHLALREVDRFFPHSAAAAVARNRVLDAAVQRGDLSTVAAMSARVPGTPMPAGLLRRWMVAADQADNPQLAHALGERLLAAHGATVSDFGPDGGRTFAQLIGRSVLPADDLTPPAVPTHTICAGIRPDDDERLTILPLEVVPGFGTTGVPPLYVLSGNRELLAYDLSTAAGCTTPLFRVSSEPGVASSQSLQLCGDRLIVAEGQRLLALDARQGDTIWTHTAADRVLTVIGIQNGIVQAWAMDPGGGEGGRIVGVDVSTGARLYEHAFPQPQENVVPRAAIGDLWTVRRSPTGNRLEIHRIDGLTGDLRRKFTLSEDLQRQLGVDLEQGNWFGLSRIQNGLLADETGVYLCLTNHRSGGGPPEVVAFEHDGSLRWKWSSETPTASLAQVAIHDVGVVLVETVGRQQPRGRVLWLDKAKGAEGREYRTEGTVRWLNEPESSDRRAPDVMVFEVTDDDLALVCFALTDHPSFRYDTHKRGMFWGRPVIGPDFLAVAQVDASSIRMELLVIDPKTRSGMLPGNRRSRSLPDRASSARSGSTVRPHGPYTICQTPDGILVLGTEEDIHK